MNRPVLQNKPDDCRDEASLHEDDLDDDIRGILSSSWSPNLSQPDDDATTTAATLTTNAIGTMSDITESSTHEQRLLPDDVPSEEGRQDQQQKKLSSSSRLNQTMRPATPKILPQHEQELRCEMKAADDPSHQYMYHPINHRYYQSRYQYNYSGGSSYNTHPEFDNHTSATASTMMGSGQQYHHHPLTYPSYYTTQDYGNYSNYPYDNHYSYYESRGSGDDLSLFDPGPTQQYAHYYPQHYNDGAATSPSSYRHQNHHQHHHTFPHHGSSSPETTPSRVVTADTSVKDGTTPSSSYTFHKSTTHSSSDGGNSLDLSSSPVDEDRKPFARSEKQADTKEQKCTAKRRRDEDVLVSYPPDSQQQGQDYEPIPLNKISAIPILSSSSSRDIASSSSYSGGGGGRGGTIPYSHPASSYTSPAAAVGGSSRSNDAHVAPPRPHATASTPASREQPRILEPSSGGSSDSTCSTSWDKRFAELIDFKRVHGHCEVPQNYSENTSLGTWVNKQRMEQKNRLDGKTSSLTDSRFERLQAVGFRWAKRKGQASWDEKLNELKLYKAKFGNCHVPTKYKNNTALGRWVSTQRSEYKKYSEGVAKTSMNADKIRRLEEIGFAWFMAL